MTISNYLSEKSIFQYQSKNVRKFDFSVFGPEKKNNNKRKNGK